MAGRPTAARAAAARKSRTAGPVAEVPRDVEDLAGRASIERSPSVEGETSPFDRRCDELGDRRRVLDDHLDGERIGARPVVVLHRQDDRVSPVVREADGRAGAGHGDAVGEVPEPVDDFPVRVVGRHGEENLVGVGRGRGCPRDPGNAGRTVRDVDRNGVRNGDRTVVVGEADPHLVRAVVGVGVAERRDGRRPVVFTVPVEIPSVLDDRALRARVARRRRVESERLTGRSDRLRDRQACDRREVGDQDLRGRGVLRSVVVRYRQRDGVRSVLPERVLRIDGVGRRPVAEVPRPGRDDSVLVVRQVGEPDRNELVGLEGGKLELGGRGAVDADRIDERVRRVPVGIGHDEPHVVVAAGSERVLDDRIGGFLLVRSVAVEVPAIDADFAVRIVRRRSVEPDRLLDVRPLGGTREGGDRSAARDHHRPRLDRPLPLVVEDPEGDQVFAGAVVGVEDDGVLGRRAVAEPPLPRRDLPVDVARFVLEPDRAADAREPIRRQRDEAEVGDRRRRGLGADEPAQLGSPALLVDHREDDGILPGQRVRVADRRSLRFGPVAEVPAIRRDPVVLVERPRGVEFDPGPGQRMARIHFEGGGRRDVEDGVLGSRRAADRSPLRGSLAGRAGPVLRSVDQTIVDPLHRRVRRRPASVGSGRPGRRLGKRIVRRVGEVPVRVVEVEGLPSVGQGAAVDLVGGDPGDRVIVDPLEEEEPGRRVSADAGRDRPAKGDARRAVRGDEAPAIEFDRLGRRVHQLDPLGGRIPVGAGPRDFVDDDRSERVGRCGGPDRGQNDRRDRDRPSDPLSHRFSPPVVRTRPARVPTRVAQRDGKTNRARRARARRRRNGGRRSARSARRPR